MPDLDTCFLISALAFLFAILAILYRHVIAANRYRDCFGVASLQGVRRYMEDAYVYDFDLCQDGGRYVLLAVLDGHGGPDCAQFCARQLPTRLGNALQEAGPQPDPTQIKQILDKTITSLDDDFVRQPTHSEVGSTAAVVLLHVRDKIDLYVCNVGDSRTVLVDGGVGVALSEDHRPERPDEFRRIEQAGGYVTHAGTWRVQGILSVSRSIGDSYLKPVVTAEPEITYRTLNGLDCYLIIACDGLWDVLSIQSAATIVQQYGSKPNYAARILAEMAIDRGSTDNVTCIVLNLHKFR